MLGKLAYEYERDDYYCWSDSAVLKNKLGIKDEKILREAERRITALKMAELVQKPLEGELNFSYLRQLHRHLFAEIYDWAGEIRQTDISKGNIFCQHELIEVNAEVLMNELRSEDYLVDLEEEEMVEKLAYYLGDLNSIHPFREGNGRVQRIFIREVALRAGYSLNFNGVTSEEMIEASDAAFRHEYELMREIIRRTIKRLKLPG